MPKHGKKYQDAFKQIDKNKVYEVNEAIELVKKVASAKFDETVEAAYRLGVDPKRADQQIRGAVVLPH
ncbi:MAG: 50S ribosomal protein L1, partial [Clostridia bacterium]